MKVLRKVCPHCGNIQFFSVEVLCRPGRAEVIGETCPMCETPLSIVATITELDMEEVGPEPDIELIRQAIARYMR